MKTALIVPTLHVRTVPDTGYYMVLPQVAAADPLYADYYKHIDGYTILDNGAAEGVEVEWSQLIDLAYALNINEIVMPDVMGHCEATVAKSKSFVEWVQNNRPFAVEDFKFSCVLQGKSMSEVIKCYNAFAYLKVFEDFVNVCCIPRILANNIHKQFRLTFMEAIENGHLDRHFDEFHALGATRFMKEVALLSETSIRGIDTSQPAVLTHHGIYIGDDSTSRSRKADFFEAVLDDDLLKRNINLYLAWAN